MNARAGTAKRTERSGERGIVLLEFVVSVGFMAMLGAIVVNMLGIGWDLNSRNSAVLDVAVDSSTSTTWFVRDIHLATSTDVPDGGAAQATAQFNWTDSGGSHACDYVLVTNELRRTCEPVAIGICICSPSRRIRPEKLSQSGSGGILRLGCSGAASPQQVQT